MKWVLVTGGSRSLSRQARRIAQMLGTGLAESGFGLVTGAWPGVDRLTSEAFCHELVRQGRSEADSYRQIVVPWWRRKPWGRYRSRHPECLVPAETRAEALETRVALSDAGVIVAGLGGAHQTAQRLIDQGKPVFPLPASGGGAFRVFQEILKTWHDNPVPGVTRTQFLQLAQPWIQGTGPLRNLLLGTLAESPDIFISYRRSDSAAASGRLHQDLAEVFGTERVFMDVDNLLPSDRWEASIEGALRSCQVGICVIGPGWMIDNPETGKPRLWDEDDFVRREIAALLEASRPLIPLCAFGGQLPEAEALPTELRPLLRYQAELVNNLSWDSVVRRLVQVIERVLTTPSPHLPAD